MNADLLWGVRNTKLGMRVVVEQMEGRKLLSADKVATYRWNAKDEGALLAWQAGLQAVIQLEAEMAKEVVGV